MKKQKKQFKAKKRSVSSWKKGFICLFIFFLCGIFLSFQVVVRFAPVTNEAFLRSLLESSNHLNQSASSSSSFFGGVFQMLSRIRLDDPKTILRQNYASFYPSVASDSNEDIEIASSKSDYIEDPYPEKETKDAIVYIYNTHQREEYAKQNVESYSITPNVMMASYILREKLGNLGIPAMVEEADVTELLNLNQWNYASSYKVTRMLMEDAKAKNESLNYYIDLHRDSVGRNLSTIEYEGKSYAKIMFIVGLENASFQENLAFTEKINQKLEERVPGISRGIYKKEGKGVNGIYNQDFSPRVILIEMGGYENTIEEVLASTELIAEVLYDVIGDDR